MRLAHKIALNHIFSSHDFKYISFSIKLSIIGLMLGVASLNIISSFSQGFKNSIQEKLTALDGHLRITSYGVSSGDLSEKDIDDIVEKLSSIPEIVNIHQYIEHKAMVQKGGISEGLIIYGTTSDAITSVYKIDSMLIEGSTDNFEDGIIIGSSLANMFSVNVGDKLNIIDIEKLVGSGEINGRKYEVTGIYKSGFAEYDKILAFLPINKAKDIFKMDQKYSGVICSVSEPADIERIDQDVIDQIGYYEYLTTTWRERHHSLYKWLTIYDLPIRIVIFFITLLALFNISVSLWMTIKEKNSEIGILRAIGFKKKKIREIFLIEGLYIGVTGSILGILLTLIILFIQDNYHVISLSSDIYFIDYLPVHWSINNILLYPMIAIVISMLFSIIPSLKSQNINPVEAISYE
jgi:lipoprotein-releasing system permease protein